MLSVSHTEKKDRRSRRTSPVRGNVQWSHAYLVLCPGEHFSGSVTAFHQKREMCSLKEEDAITTKANILLTVNLSLFLVSVEWVNSTFFMPLNLDAYHGPKYLKPHLELMDDTGLLSKYFLSAFNRKWLDRSSVLERNRRFYTFQWPFCFWWWRWQKWSYNFLQNKLMEFLTMKISVTKLSMTKNLADVPGFVEIHH